MLQRLKDKLSQKDLPDDKNAAARQPDVDAADILQGFKYVSKHLRAKDAKKRVGPPINIVVCGGACSVLVLRNRARTRGVDFFAHSADDMREILLAKRLAGNDLRAYPPAWLSADIVSTIIDSTAHDGLYEASVAQNTVMYESDVLRVYAADWRFQLVAKIARAHERGQHSGELQYGHDMADAVSILRLLVEGNQGKRVAAKDMRSWYALGPKLTDEEIECAEAAYVAVYGEPAIAHDGEADEHARRSRVLSNV